MPLAGIIAEFNPLHNGHKYIIDCAKNDGNDVACVISGNFVQRGDVAIIPKFTRAKMALKVGADIVLELPTPWSMSTAQNFALGAVSQLAALNIDTLYFGSESGDIHEILQVVDLLCSNEFNTKLNSVLSTGRTFARLRRDVVEEMLGEKVKILDNPNDTLAVEYILAARKLVLNIEFKAIKRIGAGHNDKSAVDIFSTATLLRKAIEKEDYFYLDRYMPVISIEILKHSPIAKIDRLDTAIISRLKQLEIGDLSALPDISEGIDKLILNSISKSFSYSELCANVKSKRYTMARVRRLILSAFLGIDNRYFLKEPPYVRLLGFSEQGKKYLSSPLRKPLIAKVSQINELNNISKDVFNLEMKINAVYSLSLDKPNKYCNELTQKILKE